MDADDLAHVIESLRKAAARGGDARSVVLDFGWHDLLVEDPPAAAAALFTVTGELRLPAAHHLDDVLRVAAGRSPTDAGAVVLPLPGRAWAGRRDGESIRVEGLVRTGAVPALVPCRTEAGGVRLVGVSPAAGPSTPVAGFDPGAGWDRLSVSVTAEELDDGADWEPVLAAGRRALAHDLVAVAGCMLAVTREHVLTRHQFGRPLASFQSVRHRLADVHLWGEVARLAAEATLEDDGVVVAALAKAAAGRFSRSARETCQQLLGGMGFTWEHEFHLLLRRALTLEPLLGGAEEIRAELGARVRARTVPADLLPL